MAVLFYAVPVKAASLEAHIPSYDVQIGETFELRLTYRGEATDAKPSLNGLGRAFLPVGVQSRHQTLNDKVILEWLFTLAPQKTGRFMLPSFTVGTAKSDPLPIFIHSEALAQAAPSAAEMAAMPAEDFFLQTDVDKTSPYVQEEMLMSLMLYSRHGVQEIVLLEPPTDLALVQRVNRDPYLEEVNIGGVPYRRYRWQYAVFPQKSGPFKTLPLGTEFEVLEMGQKIRMESAPTDIMVRPRPDAAMGARWLPATRVDLSEELNGAEKKIRVGTAVRRIVSLKITGMIDAQMPDLQFPETDGVKVYPGNPLKETVFRDGHYVTTLKQIFAMVPQKEGPLTLPELTVHWWDVTADKAKQAVLKNRPVTVLPEEGAVQEEAASAEPPAKTEIPVPAFLKEFLPIAAWGAGASIFAFFSFLIVRGVLRRRARVRAAMENRREVYKIVLRAARKNKPHETKTALLAYGGLIFPETPPRNIEDLAKAMRHEGLLSAMRDLSAALFRDQGADWQGEFLAVAFKDARKWMKRGQRQDEGWRKLPSLYPRRR